MRISKKNQQLLLLGGGVGIVGAVLRALMRKNELQADGSIAQGSWIYLLLPILLALAGIGLALLVWRLPGRKSLSQATCGSIGGNLPLMIAGAALLVGSVAGLFQRSDEGVMLENWLPFLGLAASGCLIAYAVVCIQARRPSPALFMVVSLYLAARLIVNFQRWNADPSVHNYAYDLLLAICSMLGTFQMAGFGFDRGKRRISLFWLLMAGILSLVTLPDVFSTGAGPLLVQLGLIALSWGCSLLLLQKVRPAPAPGEI